ncbi:MULTISPECIES: ribosome maturation factor RimM [Paenibacillus]|uniref:Ribosome maturation factor RimM n=1 Tax=Paenibacillus campinasensis TaxID=66347 RepID=A0A268ERI1_9BACL|nr:MULTISPECIES: ribosome maturation factor RimM [Paenibacillus]MUG66212.1 ribosome maturation factor RimM [Paenibacillus campinasensis]PAD75718.1 ribosome maturation factor RimM [Paenibacillus campinasensis]PAK54581.1 ribosome maturation factor RimM [Paenibacillus sp. 7541]
MSEKLYTVGKIVNTHGIRGEVKVMPYTDFADQRFAKNSTLYIVPETGNAGATQVTVETSRYHKNMYIIKFKELHGINEVEKYKGTLLKITADMQEELPDDEFYFHEIIGCRVITDDEPAEELGTISEILTPGANDVWVVRTAEGKEILLPAIPDVILDVDKHNKLVRVHLMEGLL